MKTKRFSLSLLTQLFILAFGQYIMNPFAQAVLPEAPFPLGRPDLVETRTVKELRPGLTYVHLERGSWGKDGPPKSTFTNRSGPVLDPSALAEVRSCLERAGYNVQINPIEPTSDYEKHYILTAGEFNTLREAELALRNLSCAKDLLIVEPYTMPHWDTGPYSVHIVRVDSKKYRGKLVSEWSRRAWRSSPLELALKHNSPVAINAGFFQYSEREIGGVPAGLSIVQGEWHHEHYPEKNRAAILFIENNSEGGIKLSIGYDAPPLPKLKWGKDRSMKVDGIDRMPKGQDELIAMRREVWTTSTLSHYHPRDVVGFDVLQLQLTKYGELKEEKPKYRLNEGIIGGENNIHLVLMATGKKMALLEEAMKSGTPVKLDLNIPGRPGLNALYTVPVFIRDGQVLIKQERPTSRWPLSQIGADADGNIYIIYSGYGTTANPAIATSWRERLDIAKFLGLINLANLDGGLSSSTMVVEGKDVDNPDQSLFNEDRKVGDSFLLID